MTLSLMTTATATAADSVMAAISHCHERDDVVVDDAIGYAVTAFGPSNIMQWR